MQDEHTIGVSPVMDSIDAEPSATGFPVSGLEEMFMGTLTPCQLCTVQMETVSSLVRQNNLFLILYNQQQATIVELQRQLLNLLTPVAAAPPATPTTPPATPTAPPAPPTTLKTKLRRWKHQKDIVPWC
ncbi:hypothetical protein BGX31_002760 [Mortierella sp. GBA43]|nr:hypothetical protein BGX31_002760 [Mortierella sp. GBA43]